MKSYHWRPRHAGPDAHPVSFYFDDVLNGEALLHLPSEVGYVETGTFVRSTGVEVRGYEVRLPARALGEFGLIYVRERVHDALSVVMCDALETSEVTRDDEPDD